MPPAENPYRAAALARAALRESFDRLDDSPEEAIAIAREAMALVDDADLHYNSKLRRDADQIITQASWVIARSQSAISEAEKER